MSASEAVVVGQGATGDSPPAKVREVMTTVRMALELVSEESYARRSIAIGHGAQQPPPGFSRDCVLEARRHLTEAFMWLERGMDAQAKKLIDDLPRGKK